MALAKALEKCLSHNESTISDDDRLRPEFMDDFRKEFLDVHPGRTLLPQPLEPALNDHTAESRVDSRSDAYPESVAQEYHIPGVDAQETLQKHVGALEEEPEEDEIREFRKHIARLDGKPDVRVHTYLGEGYKDRINRLYKAEPISQPDYLKTDLMEHQLRGVAKMLEGIQGHMLGCINGDEMGTGKTLTTIVACIEAKSRGLSPAHATLIVTTKSSVGEWKREFRKHFKDGCMPKVVDITTVQFRSTDYPAHDLLGAKPDFVLTTYNRIYQEFKRKESLESLTEMTYISESMDWTIQKLCCRAKSKRLTGRSQYPKNAITSGLWEGMNLSWLLVLDEAHIYQRECTRTNQALKTINASRVLALTGTFVPDKWHEVRGVINLLPGTHPFRSRESFDNAFVTYDSLGRPGTPSPREQARLVRFLLGFTISRPVTILNLQSIVESTIPYEIGTAVEGLASEQVDAYRKKLLAKAQGRLPPGDPPFSHIVRAQQICSAPVLGEISRAHLEAWREVQQSKQDEEKLLTVPKTDGEGSNGRARTPRDQAQVTRPRRKRKKTTKRAGGLTQPDSHNASDPRQSHISQAEPRQELAESVASWVSQEPDVKQDEMDTEEDEDSTLKQDDDGEYVDCLQSDSDSEDDLDDSLSESDLDNLFGDDSEGAMLESNTYIVEEEKVSPIERAKWLQKVSELEGEDILTPKVSAILEHLIRFRVEFKDEKILVFSKYLKFLDILKRGMELYPQFGEDIVPFTINGTMNDEQRDLSVRQFSRETNTSRPMFISAGSGATALNLQAASIVIICEEWWQDSTLQQAIHRAQRPGQTKQVKVFNVECPQSYGDKTVRETRMGKISRNGLIQDPIRHSDHGGEMPKIPDLSSVG